MEDLHGIIGEFLEGNIKTLGGAPVIEPKTITENGTYNAPEGVDGFTPITVNVPAPLLEDRYINANGQYGPNEGYDGIRNVIVEVPVPSILPLTITENGVYESTGGSGFNPITVAVPIIKKMTNFFNQFAGASMAITYNFNGLDITWNDGNAIDCKLSSCQSIKGASKLDIVLTTGTSYYNTYGVHAVRELYVGLTNTYYNPSTSPLSVNWLDYEHVHDDNHTYTFSYDLTNYDEPNIFVFISANGWNISNFSLELS